MKYAGVIINKLGITWSIVVVTILCVLTSVLISSIIGKVSDTTDFSSLIFAATVCPILIAPPVVYLFAKLNVCLEESKKSQEELNNILVEFNKELSKAFDQVKDQKNVLNICKVCQDIRDTRGHWITTNKQTTKK
jgi:hypothetical protein